MILSSASEDRPGALPGQPSESRTASRALAGSAREQPPARPEPVAGDFPSQPSPGRVPSDVEDSELSMPDVEDSELSMPDLARENEDWDSEDEDHPDPGKIKYWDILYTILKNCKQF